MLTDIGEGSLSIEQEILSFDSTGIDSNQFFSSCDELVVKVVVRSSGSISFQDVDKVSCGEELFVEDFGTVSLCGKLVFNVCVVVGLIGKLLHRADDVDSFSDRDVATTSLVCGH